MNQLVVINDTKDEILEPDQYFQLVKSSKDSVKSVESLEAELRTVAEACMEAKKNKQETLVQRLEHFAQCIAREQILFQHGFVEFVYADALNKGITKIKPQNSVKIIELSRYPRIIPEGPSKRLREALELNIFSEFLVVFTDLSSQDYKTPAEKKFVERNRDPIIFGVFQDPKLGKPYHRMYYITEWADDTCDLTFEKVIQTIGKQNAGTYVSAKESIEKAFGSKSKLIEDAVIAEEERKKKLRERAEVVNNPVTAPQEASAPWWKAVLGWFGR